MAGKPRGMWTKITCIVLFTHFFFFFFFFFFTPTASTSRVAALIDHFVSLIAAPNPPTLCVGVRRKTIAMWIKSISGRVETWRKKRGRRGGDNEKNVKIFPRGNQHTLYLDSPFCLYFPPIFSSSLLVLSQHFVNISCSRGSPLHFLNVFFFFLEGALV